MSLELALAENTATMRELISALANHNTVAGKPHAETGEASAPVGKPAVASTASGSQQEVPATTSSEGAAPSPSAAAPASAAKAASYDDAKAAVLAVNKKLGREAALNILRKFGTEKLPEVDAACFGDVIAECDKALGV